MTALVKVPFHGDELDAVRDERGAWVSVKRVCDSLGLNSASQGVKLRGKAWATTAMIASVAEDGKTRELAFVHLDSLPMWLATIEPSKVKPAVREKLADYQRECAKVLRDYFFGAPIVVAPGAMEARLDRLTEIMAHNAHALASLTEMVADFGSMTRTILDDASAMKRATSGVGGSKWILGQLKLYGGLMGDGTKRDASSWRARGETELRGHLGYSGAGRAWHDLPVDDFARARAKLTEMIKSAERIGQRRQQDLPGAAE